MVTPEFLRNLPAAVLIRQYGKQISRSVGPLTFGLPGWRPEAMITATAIWADINLLPHYRIQMWEIEVAEALGAQ